MISISTIRTYMFCPLKLYFQKNLDEEIKENFTVSKTIKELYSSFCFDLIKECLLFIFWKIIGNMTSIQTD